MVGPMIGTGHRRRPASAPGLSLLPAGTRIVFYGDGLGSEGAAPGDCNYPTLTLGLMRGRVRPAVGWMQHKSGGEMQTSYARRQYTSLQAAPLIVIGSMGHNPEVEGALMGTDPVANPVIIDRWKRNVQAIVDENPLAKIICCGTWKSTIAEPFASAVHAIQEAFIDGLGSRMTRWNAHQDFNPVTHSNDGIHPNPAGGIAMAASLYAVLNGMVAAATDDDILVTTAGTDFGANLDANGALAGTTGTKAGTIAPTGNYATNKRITNNLTNGAGVGVAVSKVAQSGYDQQVAVLAGTPAARNTIVQDETANRVLTGSLPGEFYEWVLKIKIDNGAGGAPNGLRTWALAFGSLGAFGNAGDLANYNADRSAPIDMLIRVPPRPVFGTSANATVNPALTTRWSAVDVSGSTITIERSRFRKVEIIAYAAPAYIGGDTIMGANQTLRITGTAAVGQTLRGDPGCWSGGALAFAPQWYADGVAISGATGWTYVVQAGDSGKSITFRPRPTNSFGSDVTTASAGAIIP